MTDRAGLVSGERRDRRMDPTDTLDVPAAPLIEAAPVARDGLASAGGRLARGFLGSGLFAGGLYLYTVVQDLADPRHMLAGAWDAAIPFVPAAVFVYLLFFPFFVLAAFVAEPRNWRRGLVASLLAGTVGWACFLLLPASLPRPDPSSLGSGLTGVLLRWLHDIDASHNTFPSLHVALTWIACLGFTHLRVFPLSIVAAVAISASTLLVKQHTLLDVAGGLLLAGACLALAGRRWLGWIASSPS